MIVENIRKLIWLKEATMDRHKRAFTLIELLVVISIIAIPIIIWSILDEEKHLIKQFGKEYIEFMKKTPWRIIPMLY